MGSAMHRVLVAIALACCAAGPAAGQEPDAPIGYVAAIDGAGAVQRADDDEPLVEGAVITASDEILTGADTRVLLVLNDGSRVVVGADTRIAMHLLAGPGAGGETDRVIDLLQGILRISVQVAGDEEPIGTRTPTAVVAARSTAWIVEYAADNTAVLALEGTVEVEATTAAGSVVLGPGFGTDVPRGEPPREPVEWGAARAEAFRERTAFAGTR